MNWDALPIPIIASGVAILLAVSLVLLRAIMGPTTYDRILAVNMMGTKTVIFLAILGSVSGRAGFLDIALLYALVNFVATVAILKFVELKRLG